MNEKPGDATGEKPRDDISPAPSVVDGGKAVDGGPARMPETGGRGGLDPTRYGDWEKTAAVSISDPDRGRTRPSDASPCS